MKRFAFPLETALEFRGRELEAVESRLQQIDTRRSYLEAKAQSLREDGRCLSEQIIQAKVVSGADLQATQHYLDRLLRERRTALEALRKLEEQRRRQLRVLVEQRRKVKLLEMLRARRLKAYLAAADRQLEAEASELYLAKRVRERNRSDAV